MNRHAFPFLSIALTAVVLLPCVAVADVSTDLIAARHIPVGKVHVTRDATTVVVRYEITEPGWCLGLTHVYTGRTPPSKGAPGRFPHHGDADCAQTFEHRVPETNADGLYLAAHAEVHAVESGITETAWAYGYARLQGGWGWYFAFYVE